MSGIRSSRSRDRRTCSCATHPQLSELKTGIFKRKTQEKVSGNKFEPLFVMTAVFFTFKMDILHQNPTSNPTVFVFDSLDEAVGKKMGCEGAIMVASVGKTRKQRLEASPFICFHLVHQARASIFPQQS